MALEKVRPSVGMVAGIRAESSLDQNVFDGLTRDPMAEPAHRLDDLGVAPAGLFAYPDNRIGDALVGPWPARLTFHFRFRPSSRPVFHRPNPAAEGRIAHDRNQVLDPRPKLFAVPNQPAPLLIVQRDPIG